MTARLDFFKYFGSPIKAKTEMARELGYYLEGHQPYTLKKEILYSKQNVRVGDILAIEQQWIKSLNSKNPQIGYNR